jgi:hypothetical protein
MATTTKALFRGAATTTLTTTLYTVPASTTTVVTSIVVSNNTASAQTATLYLNGIPFMPTSSIAANSMAVFDIKQVITAGQLIQGGASVTTVNFHISGVEIS